MQRFVGKIAIVTGAGRGIGAGIAERFAEEGAHVVVADRDEEAARTCAEMLRSRGLAASDYGVDVAEPGSVTAMFAEVEQEYGRIDVLLNNAGVARVVHFLDHPFDQWDLTLRVNLTGTFLCGQAAARLMVKTGTQGAIVNIASISGQRGGNGRAAYGASKAGVIGLTKVMAVDLAQNHIRVNAIAPGPIETEMTKVGHTPESREAYHRLVPQRRYGDPVDIANAALFLASQEAGYVTGHVLNVDGGFGAAGLLFSDLSA